MAAAQQFDQIPPSFYCDPENGLAACTICGAPFYDPSYLDATSAPPSQRWTSRAILLSDPTLDFTQISLDDVPSSSLLADRTITRVAAEPLARTYFRIVAGERKGAVVAANQVEGNFHAELYIPAHEACVYLLDRFLEARYPAPALHTGTWTVSKVWDTLRLRLEAGAGNEDSGGGIDGVEQIREPHGYYIPRGCGPAFQWADRESLLDPVNVGPYTGVLLGHAVSLPGPQSGRLLDEGNERLRQGFEQLPQELEDRIIERMHPSSPIPLTCGRILPPESWRRILSSASLTPFLWDIDQSLLATHSPAPGSELDYELLVRQLCQPDVFNDDQSLRDVPLGLRNRRRIWRVLENMQAGDMAHEARYPLSIFRQDDESEAM